MQNSPRFEFSKLLGQGPRAEVSTATQRGVKRAVAVKELYEADRRIKKKRDEFLREASEWSLLHHPTLLSILEVDEDRCWIVTNAMERPLAQLTGPVSPYMILKILRRGLEALQFLHSKNFLHLNVKLTNLLIDPSQDIVLADGRLVALHGATSLPLHLGSNRYAPPETLNPALGAVGPAADLYGLGICLMELLLGGSFERCVEGVGRNAPDSENSWLVWAASREKQLPPASTLAPSLPGELADVLDTLVLKEVSRRYGNASDALDAIAHLQLEPDHLGGALYDRTSLQTQQAATGKQPATALDSHILNEPIVVPGTRQSGAAGLLLVSGEQSGTFVSAANDTIAAGTTPDCDVQIADAHESVQHRKVIVRRGLQQGWQVELEGFSEFILNHDLKPAGTAIRSGDIVGFSVWGPYLQFLYEPPVSNAAQWNEIAEDLKIRSAMPGNAAIPSPQTAASTNAPPQAGPTAATAPSQSSGAVVAGPSGPAAPSGPAGPAAPALSGPAAPAAAEPRQTAAQGNGTTETGAAQPAEPLSPANAGGADTSDTRVSLLNYKSWDKKTLNWVVAVISIIVAAIAVIMVPAGGSSPKPPETPATPLKAKPAPGEPPPAADPPAPAAAADPPAPAAAAPDDRTSGATTP